MKKLHLFVLFLIAVLTLSAFTGCGGLGGGTSGGTTDKTTYQVEFMVNGEVYATDTVQNGSYINLYSFIENGYKCDTWFYDEEFTIPFYGNLVDNPLTGDIKVYGKLVPYSEGDNEDEPIKPEDCTHEWLLGGCYICHTECKHTYESAVCTTCDMPCSHADSTSETECTICGKAYQDAKYSINLSALDEQSGAIELTEAMYLDEILATYCTKFFYLNRFDIADITVNGQPVTNGKMLINEDTTIEIALKKDVLNVDIVTVYQSGEEQTYTITIPKSGKTINYFACMLLGGVGNLKDLLRQANVSIDGTPITDGNYVINESCEIRITRKESGNEPNPDQPIVIDFEFHLENSGQWEKQHLEILEPLTFRQVVEKYFQIDWHDYLRQYYGATDQHGNPVDENYVIDKYTLISITVKNSGSGDVANQINVTVKNKDVNQTNTYNVGVTLKQILEEFGVDYLNGDYSHVDYDNWYFELDEVVMIYWDVTIQLDKGAVIYITLNNGGSITPDQNCKHNWKNCYCSICGSYCPHHWVDNVCSTCGYGAATEADKYTSVTFEGKEYKVPLAYTLQTWLNSIGIDDREIKAYNWTVIDENGKSYNIDYPDVKPYDFGKKITVIRISNGDWEDPEVCEHDWSTGSGYCPKCDTYCAHETIGADGSCAICGVSSGAWVVNVTYGDNLFNADGQKTVSSFFKETLGLDFNEITQKGKVYFDTPDGRYTAYADKRLCDYGFDITIIIETADVDCEHEWINGYCHKCNTSCNHNFVGDTCTNCGLVSGGIDNPICVYFENSENTVPYSATFEDLFSLGILPHDLYNNEWIIIDENGFEYNVTNRYAWLSQYGRKITVKLAKCTHEWKEGYCYKCDTHCKHESTTSDGYCNTCGCYTDLKIVTVYCDGISYTADGKITFREFFKRYLGSSFDDVISKSKVYLKNPHLDGNSFSISGDSQLSDYGTELYLVIENFGDEPSKEINFYALQVYGGNDYYSFKGGSFTIYTEMTVGDFASDPFGLEFNSEMVSYWACNGKEISSEYVIQKGDVLVAYCDGITSFKEYTVNVYMEDSKDKTLESFWFNYPVPYEKILSLYDSKMGINYENYNVTVLNETSYVDTSVICFDCDVVYSTKEEPTQNVSVTLIDEKGTQPLTYSYKGDTQTLSQVLEALEIQLGNDTVSPFNNFYYYSSDGELNSQSSVNGELTIIKKSVVPETFTVSVMYTMEVGEAPLKATAKFDKPVSFYELLKYEFEMADGGYFNIQGDVYSYSILVNGEVLNSIDSLVIYKSCTLEITRAYAFSLYVEGEHPMDFISTSKLTGAQLVDKLGIDVSKYIVSSYGIYYDYEMFLNESFPQDGSNYCSLSFRPGTVILCVDRVDSMGGAYYDEHFAYASLNLKDYLDDKSTFKEYDVELKNPDGTIETLTSFDRVLEYLPEYKSEYGTSYATYYTLVLRSKFFTVTLYLDDNYLGEKNFLKSDKQTFNQILATFGDIVYDNYYWSFYAINGYPGPTSGNEVVTYSLMAYGYDNMPALSIVYNNTIYKVRHTSSLTLFEAIEAVNTTYNLSLTFEDYLWNMGGEYLTDGYTIVVYEGSNQTIYVSTLDTVKVTLFFFDRPWWNENGEVVTYTFNKDSKWNLPTEVPAGVYVDTYGIATFNGKYEYREYKEGYVGYTSTPINSVEELFALNLPEVMLYAVADINYDRLYGTYVTDSSIIVIEESRIIRAYSYDFGTKHEYNSYVINLEQQSITDSSYSFMVMFQEIQEEFKIDSTDFVVFVYDPYNSSYPTYYMSQEDYNNYIVNFNVDRITDFFGTEVSSVGYGNVYYVYTSEKPYEDAVDGTI